MEAARARQLDPMNITFDALGMQYVIEGWSTMLWARADGIPTRCGIEPDPFGPLAKGTRPVTEKHILADRQVVVMAILRWGLGYGVDTLVRPKENPLQELRDEAGDVASKPLSWLACQKRRAISEQSTGVQHEAYYAKVRSSKLGLPIVMFGDGGMVQLGSSNWSKVGLFDLRCVRTL
ncbi:unnamed protein product, partial [Clonostachys solani]